MKNRQLNRLLATTLLAMVASGSQATEQSVAIDIKSQGPGLTYSRVTPWSLTEGDQLQARLSIAGFQSNNIDDIEFNGTQYKGDISSFALQGGIDWYPFQTRFLDNIYFSTGLTYVDFNIEGTTKANQAFTVGGTQVSASDGVSLTTEVDSSAPAPYLSLGWGNRIREQPGFSFHSELGLYTPLSDSDVELTAQDPNNRLSVLDLNQEKQSIEDDIGSVGGFVSVGVSYQF